MTTMMNTAALEANTKTGTCTTASNENSEIATYLREYAARRTGGKSFSSAVTALSLAELKSKIAYAHAPLVESVARRFVGSGEPFDDLVQEGFLGLLSALDHYDPDRTATNQGHAGKKIKFSTYATHFVAGAIRHFLRDRGKIIKEPAWLHEVSVKVARTTDSLTVHLGRAPQNDEIAQALNLTEEAVEEIISTRQTFQVSAFGSSSEDGEMGNAVGLVDPEKIRSDRHVTLQLPIEDKIVLENAVLKLKELEQRVLWEFFYQDHSQTDIAKKFGISCNYVSHILKNSTQKLKRILGEAEVRDRTRTAQRDGSSEATTITCPTTSLFAASHAMARFSEAVSRAGRENRSCALLYISIKGIPDRGLKRETLMNQLGGTLQKIVRKVDVAGRAENAPDDFVLLLPQMNEEMAQCTARKIENLLTAAGAAAGEKLIVHAGVAVYPTAGRTVRELLQQARGTADYSHAFHLSAPISEIASSAPAFAAAITAS